jgi:nucleotidyltransferase/DNA polymerase involved in DNA repair
MYFLSSPQTKQTRTGAVPFVMAKRPRRYPRQNGVGSRQAEWPSCDNAEERTGFRRGLAAKKFDGMGPATASKMERLGILSGADLNAKSLSFLREHFGNSGAWHYNIARGVDWSEQRIRSW